MKTLLNCDAVFESLTAGPIVHGSETAKSLEEHIADCEECRRLADAFRPATHLIHEAMSWEQRANLPNYSPMDEFTSRVMAQIEVLPKTKSAHTRRMGVGLCVVVTGLLFLLWSQTTAEHSVPTHDPKVALESLQLPVACFDRPGQTEDAVLHPSSAEGETVFLCCTSCHNSSLNSSPRISQNMSKLIAACTSCH